MINRNTSSIAKESTVLQQENIQARKLRTRTLIQCGGLLGLSGLLEQCDIIEGEDLQHDLEGYEKAATLLGILIDANESLLHNRDARQREQFKKVGKTRMKQVAARYFYR
jgi:hypothetical protein